MRPVGRTPALVEDRHECTAAEVGEVGAASEPARQALRDGLKEAIADMAAVCIVDITQPLDVEDDDSRGGALFDQLLQTMLQMLAEELPLRKKRQRVNRRKMTCGAFGGECLQSEGHLPRELFKQQQLRFTDVGMGRSTHGQRTNRCVSHEQRQ